MKNKKSICIFAGSIIFVLLFAAVFASIVMMSDNVLMGVSVLELPADNVVFKPVLQGFGIRIQDDSICTTKKNINNYYPELLKENSVNKGLMVNGQHSRDTFFVCICHLVSHECCHFCAIKILIVTVNYFSLR
jgi:hypothetical protein